jgi:hypothetical protein
MALVCTPRDGTITIQIEEGWNPPPCRQPFCSVARIPHDARRPVCLQLEIITFPSGATSPARPQPSAFSTSPRPEHQIGSYDARACCKPAQIGRQRADGAADADAGREVGRDLRSPRCTPLCATNQIRAPTCLSLYVFPRRMMLCHPHLLLSSARLPRGSGKRQTGLRIREEGGRSKRSHRGDSQVRGDRGGA